MNLLEGFDLINTLDLVDMPGVVESSRIYFTLFSLSAIMSDMLGLSTYSANEWYIRRSTLLC